MSPTHDVDAYIAAAPGETRAALVRLRSTIRAAAPTAIESIAYQMPAYKYEGKVLIYFGAARQHVALYGSPIGGFERELAGYSTSKGTIRFPLDKPVPVTLVKKLVKARMAAIDEKVSARRETPAKTKPATTKSRKG